MKYLQPFINVMEQRIENSEDKELMKRNVFYGVKLINELEEPKNHEEAVNNFKLASGIKEVMGLLTPGEFINIFPITKDFKGYKWDMKDYFYTRDYINTLDHTKAIGEENITLFLWEYTNTDITLFNVSIMGLLSDIRRFEGKPSIAEEWASKKGIGTYTKHTDSKGNEFVIDEQGKTKKLIKQRPKHLKVVN